MVVVGGAVIVVVSDGPTGSVVVVTSVEVLGAFRAPAAVKACADWVTTTIERDGVARAVERWILDDLANPQKDLRR